MTEILFCFFLLVGLFYACEEDYEKFGIGLEVNQVALSPKGDSVLVKTEKGCWWVTVYETIDSTICLGSFCKNGVFRDTILRGQDTISRYLSPDTIVIDWFTVIRMDKDVFVKVAPNDMGKDRKIHLDLGLANEYENLYVTQAKDNEDVR